jgi:hypothetical protein
MDLYIESNDAQVRHDLQFGYDKVAARFDFPTNLRVLCVLACQNDAEFISQVGGTNRGFHLDIRGYFEEPAYKRLKLPASVEKLVALDRDLNPSHDVLVYLHGSTTMCWPGFIMTLAHELQHVLQYANHPALREQIMNMQQERASSGAEFLNDPLEREAMFVSRKIAVTICGKDAVRRHIEHQLKCAKQELTRWNFQNDWDATFSDLQTETDEALKIHRLSFPHLSS